MPSRIPGPANIYPSRVNLLFFEKSLLVSPSVFHLTHRTFDRSLASPPLSFEYSHWASIFGLGREREISHSGAPFTAPGAAVISRLRTAVPAPTPPQHRLGIDSVTIGDFFYLSWAPWRQIPLSLMVFGRTKRHTSDSGMSGSEPPPESRQPAIGLSHLDKPLPVWYSFLQHAHLALSQSTIYVCLQDTSRKLA